MPPPDQPQKPKPNMPEAARQAMLAREAAAKAKAAAGVGVSKPVVKAPPPPLAPVVPPRPRMEVGLAGFLVWLLAAVEALALIYWYRVGEASQVLALPRQVGAGLIGCGLLMAVWFTQEIEKDARIVKWVWVIAVFTIVASPVVFLLTWDRSKDVPPGRGPGVRGINARGAKVPGRP